MKPQNQSFFEKQNNWIKNSVTIKILSLGVLILILLIPTSMIKSLITERQYRREEVINEVCSKWGEIQTIAGPVITIPYNTYFKDKYNKLIKTTEYAHFLPDELNIEGIISPELRHRGIYEVVVYQSELKFNGKFSSPGFSDWNIPQSDIIWKDAFVSFGISDMKGIKENIEIKWNKSKLLFNPGIETNDLISSGVSVRILIDKDNSGQTASSAKSLQNTVLTKNNYEFSIDIVLNGSKELNFIPLGKETIVQLSSNWADPSFDGAFLPDEREISEDGFNAKWKILHLNRNYPQKWRGENNNIYDSAFGVRLYLPVDEYQKSIRSAKYAIMIISLTFLIFFFIEVLNKKRIHPIQYILVGLALCIFYTLLLSLSEHINFNIAYIISSIAIIVLITAYSKNIFNNNLLTMLMGLILAVLYGFIYTILQLQDYALLMGSIGLFIVLGIVMYLSRKIDWFSIASSVKT